MKSPTKYLMIAALIFSALFVSGQNRYFVPFPEKTFSGEWTFLVEIAAQGDEAFQVGVTGYTSTGRVALESVSDLVPSHGVFKWLSSDYASKIGRIQSLVITSEHELTGMLWMWNEALGQLNAVVISEDAGGELIVPHIPENFFKFQSSFAIQGFSGTAAPSDLEFGFYDPRGAFSGFFLLWPNFQSLAYLRRTPYYDISIGGLDDKVVAAWGRIASTDGFGLAGFQTIARADGSLQTCAVELGERGSARGAISLRHSDRLPGLEGRSFGDFLSFTNPTAAPVNVDLVLAYRYPNEGGDGFLIGTETRRVVLGAHRKSLLTVGPELFGEINGEYLALSYSATRTVDETAVDVEIFALHLKLENEGDGLGGHSFAKPGQMLESWVSLNPNFESVLQIVNGGGEATEIDVWIYHQSSSLNNGLESSNFTLVLDPFQSYILDSNQFRGSFGVPEDPAAHEIFKVVATTRSAGAIFGELLSFRGEDIAIVNPLTRIVPPVEVEDEGN